MSLAARLEKIPELLAERIDRYRVPGASLAVLHQDETWETAAGVVNRKTGVETTPDAVFQIGSITKLFTTTLIMQLVDEGRIQIDAPVRDYLPEFQLGDAEAARTVTVRQLLTHTSGIDGDFFQDTGRGDDCVERYVLACSGLGQLYPPGDQFSYCNSGFVIAGRIIEKLRGCTWDEALKRHLLEPIGADSMETLPERALYYRAALGHVIDPETREPEPAPAAFLVRSNGPAGATPFAAARDLLAFARLHLNQGAAEGGARVLSAQSVAAMQEAQVTMPASSLADSWGLGWQVFDWSGQRVIGHDGGTLGQNSYFRVIPEQGTAVVMLTNGGNTGALYRRMYAAVLEELCGIELPALAEPQEVDIDPDRYVGAYERLASRLVVEKSAAGLQLRAIERRQLFGERDMPAVPLEPVTEEVFTYSMPGSRFRAYLSFHGFEADGRARYIHAGRTAPRVY